MSAFEQLTRLRLRLPEPPCPLGAYKPAVRYGNLLFLSGMLPIRNGQPIKAGKIGKEVSIHEAYLLAQYATLNGLAVANDVLGGLDRIRQVVRLTAFLACTPDFTQHAAVADGASQLLIKVFGEHGYHARSAVGVLALPANLPVELEMIFGTEPP